MSRSVAVLTLPCSAVVLVVSSGACDGASSVGEDAGTSGSVVAWCDHGDFCVPCDGLDCSGCGTPHVCTAGTSCSDRRVDCPEDVAVPVHRDAGSPAVCAMAPPDCATEGGTDQVCVPGGTFVLGSDARAESSPAHAVYVSSFWLDRMEVTVARFRSCLAAGACTGGSADYLGDPANDPKPMVGLAVPEMIRFCAWDGGRLPTEAELERAARGDDGRTYPWGEDADCTRASWAGCSPGGLVATGSFPSGASPYGILDLIGNAAEIVADTWTDGGYDGSSAVAPVCDPIHAGYDGSVATHVVRGCGHARGADDVDGDATMARCTASFRAPGLLFEPAPIGALTSDAIGFRCARDGHR